jgi:GNAT superfamily N-acetyltransferase
MKCKTTPWRGDPNYVLRRCKLRTAAGGTVIDLDVLPADAKEPDKLQTVGDGLVASTRLKVLPDHLRVGFIEVDPNHRKKRYGTRLYEQALEEACNLNLPLSSDIQRSEFSEAFWRKQVAKGRARCVPGEGDYWEIPRLDLEEALDEGRITASEYRRAVDNAPEPERKNGYKVWPCLRYELTTNPCTTRSLEGMARRKRRCSR